MEEQRNTRRNLLVVAAVVALFVSAAGVVALAQGDQGEVFTGCLNQNSGVLKKVAIGSEPAKPCNEQEDQITWDRAGPAFEGRIAELEARVAELEEPLGTLDLFVDCDAGETIGAAMGEADTHLGQVNITISGVCEESVNVRRDDVSLSGVNRSDGIRGSSHVGQGGAVDVNGARRVSLSNMTISGGLFGIVLGGADVGVSGVTVRDTSLTGMFAQVGSILNVDDSLIVENAGSGIEAQTESIIVLANSEVSHNGGTGIGAGSATVSVNNSEIVDNQDGGAGVGNGGNLDLASTLVANNRGFAGVVSRGGQLGMSGDTRIVGNEGGGVALSIGSSLYIGTGPVRVEDNSGAGIAVADGSALRADELIVRNNGGSGISVNDLATVSVGPAGEITDNGSWGIFCAGPPAVAVIGGQGLFDPSQIVFSGNTAGDTNCQ